MIKLVEKQIKLLNKGLPLEAYDLFYDESVKMYSNGTLFASNKKEGRKKQEEFILPCSVIKGKISKKKIDSQKRISVFLLLPNFRVVLPLRILSQSVL